MKLDNLINTLKMDFSEKKRIILWIVVMVLLSAVGSGLWTNILSPALFSVGKLLFYVLTLGLTSAKPPLYRQIAKGLHESIALSIYVLVIGITNGVTIGIILIAISKLRASDSSKSSIKSATNIAKHKSLIYILCTILAVSSCILTLMLITDIYENTAITYFEQCYVICSPHMYDTDLKLVRSNFARIQNRDGYVKLIDELKIIAIKNNIELPNFDPW